MQLWVVGKYLGEPEAATKAENPIATAWSLIGVFDSEDKAKAACKSWRYWIGPIKTNETEDREAEWPDAYFPLQQRI